MTKRRGSKAGVPPEALRVIAPNPSVHKHKLADLISKTFPFPNYFDFRDGCLYRDFLHSHYDWDVSRIGLLGEKIISHWGVFDFQIRIGSGLIRCGGIGTVATHGDYRKQGILSATSQASLTAMRSAGYDMSVLFGICDFYHHFGYVSAWPGQAYTVQAEHLPKERPTVQTRAFSWRSMPDLSDMYNRHHEGLTGTAVHPTYLRMAKRWQGRLLLNDKGKSVGYLIFDISKQEPRVIEACGDPEQLLRVLSRWARSKGHKQLRLPALHYDSPLARRLRRSDVRYTRDYRGNGGAMARVVNLHSMLTKMSGVLSERLKNSALARWRGQLLIVGQEQRATLNVAAAGIKVIPAQGAKGRFEHTIRAGDQISQLLIGSASPEELLDLPAIRTTGDAASLAEALFPAQHPVLGFCDCF